jgi:thymidylate synthase
MEDIQERFTSAQDVTSAWIKAVNILMNQPRNEAFNLIVRIKDPTLEIPGQREMIEDYLGKHTRKWEQDQIEMVAQTIFPHGLLYSTCPDPQKSSQRQKFYDRYMKNKYIIRSFNINSRGTYFQRMIWWPSWDTPKEKRINQLETIIKKIKGGKASRVVHELAIDNPSISEVNSINFYNPTVDRNFMRYMSFPCLSYVSIKPESVEKQGGKIHMTALYRNHYFISRAYGNYLGLGWLLKFIADATGKKAGELLCVSSLANLEFSSVGLSKREVTDMLKILQKEKDF